MPRAVALTGRFISYHDITFLSQPDPREISLTLRLLAAPLGAALLALVAQPVIAAPPALSAGMTVLDTAGGQVGTIDSVAGGNAVISTGTNKVALPVTSFGMGDKGPIIAMTKAELDAAATKASADAASALRAQLQPGVSVLGSQGSSLGTVKAIDGEFLVLTTAQGDARLPLAAVGSGPQGPMIGMSASDLQAAMGQN